MTKNELPRELIDLSKNIDEARRLKEGFDSLFPSPSPQPWHVRHSGTVGAVIGAVVAGLTTMGTTAIAQSRQEKLAREEAERAKSDAAKAKADLDGLQKTLRDAMDEQKKREEAHRTKLNSELHNLMQALVRPDVSPSARLAGIAGLCKQTQDPHLQAVARTMASGWAAVCWDECAGVPTERKKSCDEACTAFDALIETDTTKAYDNRRMTHLRGVCKGQ